jgi:hypothetical protein
MITDFQTTLSDAQALTATAVSTNTYDNGNPTPKNEIGTGEPLVLMITVDVAADTTSGDETYQFQLIQSANANLSSQDVLLQTDTSFITRATLVAGYKIEIPVPKGMVSKRYLGARYVCGGTTPTLTVTASLIPWSMTEKQVYYASGFIIS